MKMISIPLQKCALVFACCFFTFSNLFSQYNAVVAKDGTGNTTTVQAAIDAAPTGRTTPYVIFIKKGKYVETVNIPSTKPFIQLIGESLAETIISYNNYSGKPIPTGGTYGTSTSATVTISAADCMLMNLSLENSTAYGYDANAIPVPAPGDGPQALALNVSADRVVFYNCRFNGGQDTVFAGGVGKRNYFKNCYIDGNTDFIFGNATAIFDTCIIYPRTRLDNAAGGYVTAVNTSTLSKYGYVFRDCKLTKNRGFTNYTLGRPWQNGSAGVVNKTVFLNTLMGSNITASGWSVWDAATITDSILYGEFNSAYYDGTPIDNNKRVAWSKKLTATDAIKYYNNDTVFMNATTPALTSVWNPAAVWPVIVAKAFVPEISVSNLLARKSAGQTNVTWNISFPMAGITCDLYKSTDKINFTKVSTQVSSEDTACNFNYMDALPTPGSNNYYIVKAAKTGFASITSDTAYISSTPTLYVYGALGSFLQGVGAPSAAQVYQLSGVNLIGNVVITAPNRFEISLDGVNWFDKSTPITITVSSNTLATTNLYVRMNATVPGVYTDTVFHVTTGGLSVALKVSGKMLSVALLNDSFILTQWPLTVSTTDSSAIRDAGIVATLPKFSSMVQPSTLGTAPEFSAKGQAFANDGSIGKWSVGASLNRNSYYQFQVVAASTHKVRLDSLLFNLSYQSTANGTVAVVYSKSAFRKDSANIASGIGYTGVGLPAANFGSFAKPAIVGRLANNNDSTLRFLFTDSNVTINAGDTLTFRLYVGAGSTSSPRFAYLKNVIVKGHSTATTLPLNLTRFTGSFQGQKGNQLTWLTTNEKNMRQFVVEKGVNSELFTAIGTMTAKNNAAQNTYQFTDAQQTNGTHYYRLKMVDNDGQFSYSYLVKVVGDVGSNHPVLLYPNPAKSIVTLQFAAPSTPATAVIYGINGKKMMARSIAANIQTQTLDVKGLPSGQYTIVIQPTNGSSTILQFTKE